MGETVCPFWDVSRRRAAATRTAVEAAIAIMGSAAIPARLRRTAREVHRVICANMDIACVREAVAEYAVWEWLSPSQSNESNPSRPLTIDHTLFRFDCI